jgi:hypothetical protein
LAPTLLLALIQRSAWKVNSQKFGCSLVALLPNLPCTRCIDDRNVARTAGRTGYSGLRRVPRIDTIQRTSWSTLSRKFACEIMPVHERHAPAGTRRSPLGTRGRPIHSTGEGCPSFLRCRRNQSGAARVPLDYGWLRPGPRKSGHRGGGTTAEWPYPENCAGPRSGRGSPPRARPSPRCWPRTSARATLASGHRSLPARRRSPCRGERSLPPASLPYSKRSQRCPQSPHLSALPNRPVPRGP